MAGLPSAGFKRGAVAAGAVGSEGAPPRPQVIKPRSKLDRRLGRGFSLGELRQAGLTPEEALRMKVPIDRRRHSAHEWNVELLRSYLAPRMGPQGAAGAEAVG
jgi:large subunit ribosomal protein L13e